MSRKNRLSRLERIARITNVVSNDQDIDTSDLEAAYNHSVAAWNGYKKSYRGDPGPAYFQKLIDERNELYPDHQYSKKVTELDIYDKANLLRIGGRRPKPLPDDYHERKDKT